ncbi:MAG: hypothetical protein RIR73_1878, partial [Chloroflexota bacterium]
MRKFMSSAGRVITFPFRLIFTILAFPFKAVYRFYVFLNTEPDERPITDIFADIATQPEVRSQLWDQVEAFRMHLLRALLSVILTVALSFSFSRDLSLILAQPLEGEISLETIEVTEGVGTFMKIVLLS